MSSLNYFLNACKKEGMDEKKTFSTRIDTDKIKKLKHLAVDTDKSLGDLLGEAIQDLVDKYKRMEDSNE